MGRTKQRASKGRRRRPGAAKAVGPQTPAEYTLQPTPGVSARRAPLMTALCGLVLVCVAVGLYARTYAFDYTYLDDDLLILNKISFLSDIGNLPRAFGRTFFDKLASGEKYYRPVVTASFIIDASMSGGKIASFHATNVLLHGIGTALCFLLLLQLRYSRSLAAAVALLFAVHPVLVGAVAWVPGRVYQLTAVFSLGALLLFLRWRDGRRMSAYVGHLVCLAAALLCQEGAVVMPFVLAAWIWLEGDRTELRRPMLWIGWGGVLLAWMVVWLNIAAPGSSKDPSQYVSSFFRHLPALLIYLGKTFVPYRLSVLPTMQDSSWVPGLVVVALLVGLGWRLRGHQQRRFVWGLIWYFAWLVPSLPATDYVLLEGRLYLSLPGALIALLALAEHYAVLSRLQQHRWVSVTLLAAVVGGGVAAAWTVSESYRDRDAFTKQAVLDSPRSALAHQSRGLVLYRSGKLEPAEHHFREAVRLGPKLPVVNGNLGAVLLQRGQLEEAQRFLQQELQKNPGNDLAHYNLALTLKRRGDPGRALQHFRLATEFNPANVNAFGEMLGYYAKRGMWDEADRCKARMEQLGVKFVDRPQPVGPASP